MIIEATPDFAKFEKCINVLINDNSEYSIAPRCNFNLTQEQDCRRDFPEYNSLLQAHMNLQEDYSILCKQNYTLWTVIEIFLKFTRKTSRRSQRSKLSHTASLKRDPMSIQIYTTLLELAKGSTYLKIRLRVALCILFVTGINLNTLLFLRVSQLITIREKGWIAIDKPSLESSSSKAHLTKIGKTILRNREEDFTALFLNKTSDDFVFTSQRKPYNRKFHDTSLNL